MLTRIARAGRLIVIGLAAAALLVTGLNNSFEADHADAAAPVAAPVGSPVLGQVDIVETASVTRKLKYTGSSGGGYYVFTVVRTGITVRVNAPKGFTAGPTIVAGGCYNVTTGENNIYQGHTAATC